MSLQPHCKAPSSAEFDAIVADLDQVVRCEMDTASGSACKRPAHWRIHLHGCEQANACGQHLHVWLRWAAASTWRCDHCKRVFSSADDAYAVTAL